MKLKSSFTTYQEDGKHMLVSLNSAEFAGVVRNNETSAVVIEALKTETTPEALAQQLSETYDVPVEQTAKDVATILDTLRSIGALEEQDDDPLGASTHACKGIAGSFEDQLQKHGSFAYRSMGGSMRPLIRQGRDLIVVGRKPKGRCKKYDVVLYKRGNRYILHRIVDVTENGYVICGDDCMALEHDIGDDQIIGVMTKLVRAGREILTTDATYQRYAHIWVALYPIRKPLMRARAVVGRAYRRLAGK